MGIPGFFHWLTRKCPRSLAEVVEDYPAVVNGVEIPVDTMKPNPNGFEFDNLYLDMNGIIHPCFHPEKLPSPNSYDEVFSAAFKYIDRIFSLIRPRKLLYIAIDGVAPRAKMNQQRVRRFRAAKEAADEAAVSNGLDPNVITPGTGFMELLSSALQYYIHLRMNDDPGWKAVKVILSDASVPGEGEHKIMSYIRLQRNLPGYDPNTRHCLYGLDADLIMLALATHEIHFSVLREDVCRAPVGGKGCKENKTADSGNLKSMEGFSSHLDVISRQKFQFVNVWVLREYLAKYLRIPGQSVNVDPERLIDDFVFMCLFVGNDFLPHVPSLEISEGAISLLISAYRIEFVRMGGYLTDSSEVNLKRVEHFLQTLGSHENAIFKERRQQSSGKRRKILANRAKFKARFVVDKVNLGEDGWKERYYSEKFEVQTEDDRETVRKYAVLKYVEGICWVMRYYYQGVCSWQWFYPYHYAPFASDFRGLDQLKVDFVLGKPFKPFSQLMGVLPAASAQALPLLYRNLMTDPSSPILDFYPTEFELDLNGRKQAWKAVCRLPFIEEGRLLAEIAKVEHTLTDAERQRNTFGLDKLFVHMSHALAAKIFTFLERNKDNPRLHKAKVKRKINPKLSGGMNGYMYISDNTISPTEISSPLCGMKTILNNKVVFVFYKYPEFHPHIPRPPEGVRMPPQTSIGKCKLLPPPTLCHAKTAIGRSRFTKRASGKLLPPPTLCCAKTAISQSRFTRRPPPPWMSVAGPWMAKSTHQISFATRLVKSSQNQGKVGERTHDTLSNTNKKTRLRQDALNANSTKKLDSTCLISKSEDQGEVGKMTHDALNDNKRERNKRKRLRQKLKRKLNSACLASNGEDQGEIGERTHDALNDSATTKLDNACLVSNSKGEFGNRTHDAPNDNKKRKHNQGRKLNSACLASNSEEQGEVGKLTHDALNANSTTKLDSACLVNKSEDQGVVGKMTHDALNDNNNKRERNKRKRLRQKLKRKLNSACLASNGKDQGEIGERTHDTLNHNTTTKLDNACLVSNSKGEFGNMIHDAQNDNKKKRKRNQERKLNRACLASNSEEQGEVGKMTQDALNDNRTTKLDGTCLVSKSEDQVEVGKMPQDALNDTTTIKLKSACLISNREDQGEVRKMRQDAINANSTTKLDSACLVSKSEDQGEVGKMMHDATYDNNNKRERNKRKRLRQKLKRKLTSACLASNSKDQGKVWEIRLDALDAKNTTKLDSTYSGDNSENQGQVKMTHGALNDNTTVKSDSTCLVSNNEDKGEIGERKNDALNDSNKKLKKRNKRKLNSTYLTSNGEDQGVVRKRTHDAVNDSTTKLDSACSVSKIEDQGEVGEKTNDALNNSKKKRKKQNKKRKLDTTCLLNSEDQGVVKLTHDAVNDNTTKLE